MMAKTCYVSFAYLVVVAVASMVVKRSSLEASLEASLVIFSMILAAICEKQEGERNEKKRH